VEAREAVLNFLRDGANECVPPAAAHWRSEIGPAPHGFSVYRFHTGDCLMTVAYPLQADETTYHVALHNGTGGFCWQANVSDNGRVVTTGSAATLMPALTEAAAAYCREQGYQYEVQQQRDGSRCGVCTFPDGSRCKAWLFYQEECKLVEPMATPQ
jgi:putative hemolysin